ncbi:hypothetical protein HUB98_05505 [Paenibacillus barcinonensis]|uniref:Uncharacterized protein n=1 Tax=Paenibacillus barcinonensis TaxID=198119 RepID=A0A2V4VVW4_PAEBA|nr:hypothetical protein [Paenibacillus barcinonensis]PYE51446.1 hypothetical protein DFQ00_102240 [Paenibacillus barcinonensis]QKS55838.1 hypothetical protein HUB98_05505 [Paenibacillus barcinonensis]
MNQIMVRCIESFQEFNRGNITCEVQEDEELQAELYEEAEEYFATDSKGRDVYVGKINFNGEIELEECFELIEGGCIDDKQ